MTKAYVVGNKYYTRASSAGYENIWQAKKKLRYLFCMRACEMLVFLIPHVPVPPTGTSLNPILFKEIRKRWKNPWLFLCELFQGMQIHIHTLWFFKPQMMITTHKSNNCWSSFNGKKNCIYQLVTFGWLPIGTVPNVVSKNLMAINYQCGNILVNIGT